MIAESLKKEPQKWHGLRILVEQNVRDLRDDRYGRLTDVVSWFKAIEVFRQFEEAHMVEKNPTPADKRSHKGILEALIDSGKELLSAVRASGGLGRNQAGIKRSDISATIEELRTSWLQWYGTMTGRRRDELWKEVFNVKAPTA